MGVFFLVGFMCCLRPMELLSSLICVCVCLGYGINPRMHNIVALERHQIIAITGSGGACVNEKE